MLPVKCSSFECIYADSCPGNCSDCAGFGCSGCTHLLSCMDSQEDCPAGGMDPDKAEGVLVI